MRRCKLSRFAIVTVIITGLIIAFLFLADPLFDLNFGFITDRRTASSSLEVLAGRDLLELNTLEAVYKIVFPHDFYPSDLNWRLLVDSVESGRRVPSIEEEAYLDLYRFAAGIGFDLASNKNDFVVVTVVAKIGLDLDRRISEPISMRDDGTVIVTLPPAIITDLIIEDNSSEDYPYPDVSVTPENWRRLSAFVSGSVSQCITESGIFDEAEENARSFLRSFFVEAGYESVIFAE